MISALILTLNEEKILPLCLEALSFVDEIIVLDSYSSDRTVSIAKSHGARVVQREFDNYANQRNAGLNEVKSDWVLMVDADEIVSEELRQEILKVTRSDSSVSMYRIRRKDFFQGKWLKYSSGYPTWFPRLFKNGHVKVEREINEEYLTEGGVSNLNEHLLHFPFNKGINWWFEKHNLYSSMEAKKMICEIKEPLKVRTLFSKDPVVRRKFLKRLSYRVPFRPQVIFLSFFLIRKGFMDGSIGYTYCRMRAIYEMMIEVKFNLNDD